VGLLVFKDLARFIVEGIYVISSQLKIFYEKICKDGISPFFWHEYAYKFQNFRDLNNVFVAYPEFSLKKHKRRDSIEVFNYDNMNG